MGLTSRCFPISPICLCSLQPSSSSSPLPRVRGRTSAVRRRWLVPPTTPCSPTTTISFPWPAWTTVSTRSPTPPHPNIALKKVICQLSAYLTQQQQQQLHLQLQVHLQLHLQPHLQLQLH